MEISAAALSVCSISSGRISDRSEAEVLVRKPTARITLAYAMLSVMILPISGKCQPYHSFTRMA